MNFSKPANAKPAVVHRTIVNVPVKPAPKPGLLLPNGNRFRLSERSVSSPVTTKKAPPKPVQRALSTAQRGTKRKSATPQPVWSSDEDSTSEIGASDSDDSRRKRIKSSVTSVESTGPKRKVILEEVYQDKSTPLELIHGADATSGIYDAKFKLPWEEDELTCVDLQYPTPGHTERFELKFPKNEREDYKPMEDIIETIDTICTFYFPSELSRKHTGEETGFRRRFTRAFQRQSIPDFTALVAEFNTLTTSLLASGAIRTELASHHTLHLDWTRRLLDQIYARTVSPTVETLRHYQNGTDYVYGELLPPLISAILSRTGLSQTSTFVDLGSGVGNVVLQAALQTGAEAWGIEFMPAPSRLAALQAAEFQSRARLWGVAVGSTHLLQGDFTDPPAALSAVLKRADVVLVNNQAFTPALNEQLRDIFLDLKEGCQIVSLKPFVPAGHRITARNVESVVNRLVQQRFEYWSGSVSWTDGGGEWFNARVDRGPLRAFLSGKGKERRR